MCFVIPLRKKCPLKPSATSFPKSPADPAGLFYWPCNVRKAAGALSVVIDFIAVSLPWLLFVILPITFGLRWLWRKRKKTC
jgi:hypothetical protein